MLCCSWVACCLSVRFFSCHIFRFRFHVLILICDSPVVNLIGIEMHDFQRVTPMTDSLISFRREADLEFTVTLEINILISCN